MSRRHFIPPMDENFAEVFDRLFTNCRRQQKKMFGNPVLMNNYVRLVDTVLRMVMMFEEHIYELARKNNTDTQEVIKHIIVEHPSRLTMRKREPNPIMFHNLSVMRREYNPNKATEDLSDYDKWVQFFANKYPDRVKNELNLGWKRFKHYEAARKCFLSNLYQYESELTPREVAFVFMYVCKVITNCSPDLQLTVSRQTYPATRLTLDEKFDILAQISSGNNPLLVTEEIRIPNKISSLLEAYHLCANEFPELVDIGSSNYLLGQPVRDLYVTHDVVFARNPWGVILEKDDEYLPLDMSQYISTIPKLLSEFNQLITIGKVY